MQRKFKITVDGRSYNVTVEDQTEAGATLHPSPGPMSAVAPAASPAAAAAVVERPSAPAAAGAGDEVAPLGGVVQTIEVSVGQQVSEGDKIVVLEAMKMKTTVYAKHSGKVTRIAVKVGDGVEAGQALMTIA